MCSFCDKSQSAVCFASAASTALSAAARHVQFLRQVAKCSYGFAVVQLPLCGVKLFGQVQKLMLFSQAKTNLFPSIKHIQVFGTKTFLNFGSNASNTARSCGTAALCGAKAALRWNRYCTFFYTVRLRTLHRLFSFVCKFSLILIHIFPKLPIYTNS